MRFFLKVILAAVALAAGHHVAAADLQEGRDFTVIAAAKTPDKSSKIVVTEFFSYQCPHCFAFSKPLHDWTKKVAADVHFERKAVSIGHRPWEDIARSFYALQHMKRLAELDADIFSAIHKEGVRLDNLGLIMGWLNKKSVPLMEFDSAYRSPLVRGAFEQGEQLSAQYQIPSIPTMVVDGKYRVIIASDVSFEQQLAVVDKLIERARAERSKQSLR